MRRRFLTPWWDGAPCRESEGLPPFAWLKTTVNAAGTIPFAQAVGGLLPGTNYQYRVAATNHGRHLDRACGDDAVAKRFFGHRA